ARARHPAAQEPAEGVARRYRTEVPVAGEGAPLALRIPEAQVEVHAGAGEALIPLRHKGDGAALRVGDLLCRLLGEGGAVRLRQRVAVAEVDLLLAGPPLPLAELHRHAARLQRPPDSADQLLLLRSLEDMVVLDVAPDGLEVVILLRARRFVRLVEG